MTISFAVLECSFSSSFSLICRLVWKITHSLFTLTFLWCAALSDPRLIGQRWADLGLVELQLVIGDPPGFLGLQPLCCLLLHVILLQPERLNQLLKCQLTVWKNKANLIHCDNMQKDGSDLGLLRSYLCFLGLVLMSPRTMMSEKSILNRLSSVAILVW